MSNQPTARITVAELKSEIGDIAKHLEYGCGDGGCRIRKPTGMHTNASCRCLPSRFAERLFHLACELDSYGRYSQFPNTEQPKQEA